MSLARRRGDGCGQKIFDAVGFIVGVALVTMRVAARCGVVHIARLIDQASIREERAEVGRGDGAATVGHVRRMQWRSGPPITLKNARTFRGD